MARMAGFILAVICPLFASDTITFRDGSQHYGTLVGSSERTITFSQNGVKHTYDISQIESVRFDPTITSRMDRTGSHADRSANLTGRSIPMGTEIAVRNNEDIQANAPSTGRYYAGTIERDVADSTGQVIIPQGSEAQLVVRAISAGSPGVILTLRSVAVGGRTYLLSRQSPQAKRRSTEMAGAAGTIGSVVGAMSGARAGVGALAGEMNADTQVLTQGKNVSVPAETVLTFRLDKPLYLQGS